MRDMTIAEFCQKNVICDEGTTWALSECDSCIDAWEKLNPEWLLYVATRPDVLSDADLRRLACWCASQVWNLMADSRSENAVVASLAYANGETTLEALQLAEQAAIDAIREDVNNSARKAAWCSARTPASVIVLETSLYACAASENPTQYLEDQAAWIRANLTPSFTYVE